MDAGTLSLGDIFRKDVRHIVPLFQRPYVWQRESQWEPLWEDIRAVAERLLDEKPTRPHFLGAIVLDQVQNRSGDTELRLVIDGQQRLTTVQIVLEAFRDICAAAGAEKHTKSLVKLTRNDDPQSDDVDIIFKIWPTNADRDHFRKVMLAESPSEVLVSYGSKPGQQTVGHPIPDSYLFFSGELTGWLNADNDFEHRVEVLYQTLRDYVRMVVIDLNQDDDAQLIFETLNARGTPLLPSDLVKNYLFHKASAAGYDLEVLYRKYWRPFDNDASYWREKIGSGHAARARLDVFLLHYLTLRKEDEVQVGHLYDTFRDYAEATTNTPEELLASLHSYAAAFRGFDSFAPSTREGVFFRRLALIDVTSLYPFVLELFQRTSTGRDAIPKLLHDLESFLVRRMICQLNTRGYNRFFIELIRRLDTDAAQTTRNVREFLLSQDADGSRWPDDKEFKHAWLNAPVYRSLVRRRIRMLFEALEQHLHSEKVEKVQFGETLSVEHLLPQSWGHWPLPEDRPREEAEARRERLLHTLGNLTLISKRLNSAQSNAPWAKKRKEILKHSKLFLNIPLQETEIWDEDAIEERSAELFEAAVRIWPRPRP